MGIIVIGCGLHFTIRHYISLCENVDASDLKIHLVVDLKSEEVKIRNFFNDKKLQPENYLFLPEHQRNVIDINSFHEQVIKLIDLNKVDGVLICAEPKVHKPYILWAIENNLNIFSDKPLTAFSSLKEKDSLYTDYSEIQSALKEKDLNFVLCCDRRGHLGYQYLRSHIAEIIKTYGIPITYVGIHYGDGVWNMPDEFFTRENHPHKYGYGILLHSGYHYIDLLMSFVLLNRSLFPLKMDESEVFTLLTTPSLFLRNIPNEVYNKNFKTNRFKKYFEEQSIKEMDMMGETDALIMGRFNYQKQVVTNFSLQMLEATATKRTSDKLPENLYLNNGRMHLENVTIHIGPLCSIQIDVNHFIKQAQDDGLEDFTVTIMRNPEFLKLPALSRLTRRDFSKLCSNLSDKESMNVKSRAWQLTEFLEGKDGNSSLDSHKDSVFLLDSIFKNTIPNPVLN